MTPEAVAYSMRFRHVSTAYPRAVTEAYGRDVATALDDDSATVAERVAAWERSHGWEPRD
jgi:hypothetical protein